MSVPQQTLSEKAVREMISLCEKHFGVKPSAAEAQHDLLALMSLIAATQPRSSTAEKHVV